MAWFLAPALQVTAAAAGAPLDAPNGPPRPSWSSPSPKLFGVPGGCNGSVFAIVVMPSGLVYLGGDFSVCEEIPAAQVVAYDPRTRRFQALGSDSANGVSGGVFGAVYSLAVQGNDLLVAGDFDFAGGVPANNIARWNGQTWSSVGSGPENGVSGLIYDVVTTGADIYVGGILNFAGSLPANNVARWNGSDWSTLSSGIEAAINPAVYNLVIVGPDLYAGGVFSAAGGAPANNIARWNGSSWSALGSGTSNGVNGPVTGLAVYQGDLHVGGFYTEAGGQSANAIARWTGSAWALLGTPANNGVGGALAQTLWVANNELYVGGNFESAGGVSARFVARWNGSVWSGLGEETTNGVNSTVFALAGSGSELYVGGVFDEAGGENASAVANFDGNAWSALGSGTGNGLNNQVHALAVLGDDLYAGGFFTRAGGGAANRIARWTGSAWFPLGEGEANGVDNPVLALAAFQGELYAGGAFGRAGGAPQRLIARWDGKAWSDVGGGVGGGDFPNVRVITPVGTDLYVGGEFIEAGGQAANKIARWNGSSWSALGSGAANGVSPGDFIAVHAIAALGSDVYAGGGFLQAGGQDANFIARWNGNAWSPLGNGAANGVNNLVYALATLDGELYVGGAFSMAGGQEAFGIARWDGTAWTTLGNGVNGIVQSLVVSGSDLYVGGSFSLAGGQPANGLARWNGAAWEGLSVDAPPQIVRAMVVDEQTLYAGGAGLSQTPLPELQSRPILGGVADGSSEQPVVSRGGTWLSFASSATNLVADDDNPGSDVFLRNTLTGQLTRVSALVGASKGAGTESFSAPSISADGSAVAFAGSSGQLYGSIGGLGRVLSRSASGALGNAASGNVQLPASGTLALFDSQATNLLDAIDGNGSVSDIFATDLVSGAVSRISAGPAGEAANGPSTAPWGSADGQSVVFISEATNLVASAQADKSVTGGVTQALLSSSGGLGRSVSYLSRNPASGELGNGNSSQVRITPDGRFGVFESRANNLVAADSNGVSDIFRFELGNQQLIRLERVSTSRYGFEANGASFNPSISDDGQFVTFQTEASNLIELDRNDAADVLVKWMLTGEVLRLSRTIDGAQPDGDSVAPVISGDGSTIVFGSSASNLTAGDDNGLADIYAVRIREPAGPAIVDGVRNYSYTYWNPAEPGWGYNMQHQGNLLYGTWYTYSDDGEVMFLTVEALAQADGSFTGPVYRVAGTPFQLIDDAPAVTAVSEVGSAQMRFDAAGRLTLDYSVFGVEQTRQLEPFVFVSDPPSCFSTLDSRAGARNYSDLWWNSREPGWGLTLAHQGNTVFALWYTYGEGGRDQWISASALTLQPDGSYRGALQRPDAGTPLAAIMGPATSFPVPAIGSAELRFSDGASGTFSYMLDGVSQSKPIERFVVVGADQFKPLCVD
jgi:Tol biopolymer transport system component